MKTYYYEYKTHVFQAWNEPEPYLRYGFLMETPFGIIQVLDEDELDIWGDISEFEKQVHKFLPIDLQIVELK